MHFRHVFIGLVLSWPSSHSLQTGGPARIVKGRRDAYCTVSGASGGSRSRKAHTRKSRGGGRGGGGEGDRSCLTRHQDRSVDRYRFSIPSNNRIRASTWQRKATFRKLKRGGNMSMMARLRRKMKDASNVPDLSRMLSDGLPYLARSEATEVQLALAVSLYAHSNYNSSYSSRTVHALHDDRVKAGVEVCIELGRLGMGRDALLAAILGGVLRPETSREHSTHPGFGRAPVTLVDIREGFGKNVARLVEGVEHVTCVEETAHRVLRGRHSERGRGAREELDPETGWTAKKQDDDDDDELLSISMLIGARERLPGEPVGGRGRDVKPRSLREASALEQGESLRNLIVSEAADWQVLMLRLAVQLRALKTSTIETDGDSSNCKQLARDALLVYAPLAHRLGIHQLRNEIETVAFRKLFPQQFDKVRSATMDRSVVYEKVAEATKVTLRQALEDAPAFTSQVCT
ncbi:unnamed protein product [Hapterophycus canaliculatus]